MSDEPEAGEQTEQPRDPQTQVQEEAGPAVVRVAAGDAADPVEAVVQRGAVHVQLVRGGGRGARVPQVGLQGAHEHATTVCGQQRRDRRGQRGGVELRDP